jgi:hypothetical protein
MYNCWDLTRVCVLFFCPHPPRNQSTAWVNNCIGERNHRFFLLFLFMTSSLCLYGAWLGGSILYGQRAARHIDQVQIRDEVTGEWRPLTWREQAQWVVYTHTALSGVSFFALLLGVFVAGFLAFQVSLVARNITSNETFKWKDWQREQAHRQAAAAAAGGSSGRGVSAGPPRRSGGVGVLGKGWTTRLREVLTCWGRLGGGGGGAQLPLPPIPPNPYNKGLRANVLEVLFPPRVGKAGKRN